MKRILLLLYILPLFALAQDFSIAYQQNESIPKGVLEAVAWTRTRMNGIGENDPESCTGMPKPFGFMGLFENGKEHFIENAKRVALFSGVTVTQQKESFQIQLNAYAMAFETIFNQQDAELTLEEKIYRTLIELSEIPGDGRINLYARDAQVYEILRFLTDTDFSEKHGFIPYEFDLSLVFGNENLKVLSAPKVLFEENGIVNEMGEAYFPLYYMTLKSADYEPAEWAPTPSCNHGGERSPSNISAVVIHTAQGTYAGTISWAQNCISNVSYHYVIRSSDGQVTQMLFETTFGWHAGSVNSYTIGYEHEGWVDSVGWYTQAMYESSADLTRSITNKNYEADLKNVRTYYGTSLGVLGGCTRIKGHQHYPNQTHTDPGALWDWERYYKLVNIPTITMLTDGEGVLIDSGGESSDYANDERLLWCIAPEGAESVSLEFTGFELEENWDFLFLYDGDNPDAPLIGKYTGNETPGTVTANSGKLLVEFRSDCATTKPGWVANWMADFGDDTPPTSEVVLTQSWESEDFEVSFLDIDEENGSGVAKGYYQVSYLDENSWTANEGRGFFSDDFDGVELSSNWINGVGNWQLTADNTLKQIDESVDNSKWSAALNQELSNQYVYSWKGKISGEGTNRRAGIHIFCDSVVGNERNNSYLIYFRAEGNPDAGNNNKVQIYKTIDNQLNFMKSEDVVVLSDVWYEYTVIFDRITGDMSVFMDGELIVRWKDDFPHQEGNYFSFRNGNSVYEIDEVRVYRSRFPEALVSVGPEEEMDVRTQNVNPFSPAAKISTLAIDQAHNLSEVSSEYINIDWTAPLAFEVRDGFEEDTDLFNTSSIRANWQAFDPNSGIAEYQIAVGTTPGGEDVIPWITNGLSEALSYTVTSLEEGVIYYVSVRAVNKAGLITEEVSDGQKYTEEDLSIFETDDFKLFIYPNPTTDKIWLEGLTQSTSVFIYDINGKLVLDSTLSPIVNSVSVESLSAGTYRLVLNYSNKIVSYQIIKK